MPHTEQLAENITNVSKIYSSVESYAEQLGSQKIITLPELAKLYGMAKQLSDDKIATTVLTILIAKHLASKAEKNCQQTHINDAKNITAATKTYFKQEAAVDAMVYMVSSLCRAPDNYQLAANQGKKAELKKLAGAKIFSASNQDKVNHIRLLLIAAQNIASQTEEQQLDDAHIIFTIKQELLKQGIDKNLAEAVAIVYGASYFFEDNYSIPSQIHLEKSAECLAKREAIITHQANQTSIIKFLQEYFKTEGTTEQTLATALELKADVLSGKSIEGRLKFQGSTNEQAWKTFILAQDYAAKYYFSPVDGAFKIDRDNNQDNSFYGATLQAIQLALHEDPNNQIHKLTTENLSKQIKALLPLSRGIIVEHFSNIIRNQANILSVPTELTEELTLLRNSWQQRDNLSPTSKEILDQDINNYLETISSRYIELVNNNPEIGYEIELKIIAHYYNVQIKLHSHLNDNYNVINPEANNIVHMFLALYQAKYYNLVSEKDLKKSDQQSVASYIKQAAHAAACTKETTLSLEPAIAMLALQNPMVWQANDVQFDAELLKETIKNAKKETASIISSILDKSTEKLFKQIINPKITTNTAQQTKQDLILSPTPSEQLKVIEQEAKCSITNIKLAAKTGLEATLIAFKEQAKIKSSLVNTKQIVNYNNLNKAALAYYQALFIEELKALGIAKIEAYSSWWQSLITEQRNSIETVFIECNRQIDAHIQELTKAYEQQISAIDQHYNNLTNRTIQAYNDHQRYVAEQERNARKKRRRKIIRSFAGMAIAAFVAPVLAQSMFSAGTFSCAVATGAIAGGISSGIAGNNVFKGAAMGGLFAGFGFGVDQALGKFIESSDLLRSSLNVAATASLSSAIHGGKLLDNVLVSVGANVAASLLVPMPTFAANKNLTKPQINAINNRQVIRAFTRGMTASVISKDHNLGMSLITSGMSGLQTWADHQANMYAQERKAAQQQSPIRNTNSPRINKGRIGRYKINLPKIELTATSPLKPNTRSIIFIDKQDPLAMYRGISVSSPPDPIESDLGLNLGTRALGLAQAAGGALQVSASIAGGVASLETGIGPIIAAGYAAVGVDNIIAGTRAFITGKHQPTILFQAARDAGLSNTAATWFELGANLGPSVPGMTREGLNIAKNSMLKLYDISTAHKLKWFEPKYVSTGGLRNELPLTAAQKQEALDYAISLGMPKESIVFVENGNTGYKLFFGQMERLQIGTDVLPLVSTQSAANSRVTMRGALAHEIIGHRAAEFANMTQSNAVLEEAQASIRAARFAEGLTGSERTILLRDGIERLRNAGYKIADVKHELWINEDLKLQLTPSPVF